jgi:formylmethanofuran dehydrogenase subunit E
MVDRARMQHFFAEAGTRHNHVCPRIVLGVRMALLAEARLALTLPQQDKRLLTLVETDGCFADGIAVVTGCELGHRTLRLVDYGKVAATFIDTDTGRALRIAPHPASRDRAPVVIPQADSRWHQYLEAYQVMPDHELLTVQPVTPNFSVPALRSNPTARAICAVCGEEIVNEREVWRDGVTLCRSCAEGAYYGFPAAPDAAAVLTPALLGQLD